MFYIQKVEYRNMKKKLMILKNMKLKLLVCGGKHLTKLISDILLRQRNGLMVYSKI